MLDTTRQMCIMKMEVIIMRTRTEIKDLAKQKLKVQHGNAFLIYFVGIIVLGAAATTFPGVGGLLAIPVASGQSLAFLSIWRGNTAEVGDIFKPFRDYGRILGGLLWMQLWIYIWSLLLIIPGIIKAFAYSLTPYILVDCPNISATDAIKISMRMTNGYKGKIFIFFLSYIGWGILTCLTFGILELAYVGPYRGIAFAGLYEELKANALRSGNVTKAELEIAE